MTFKDRFGQKLPAAALEAEYKAAEKKFSVRLGDAHLFIRRLFRTDCLPFSSIVEICFEDERVDCPTSEFPFEGNIFRLYFTTDAPTPCKVEVDSAVKAERIRDAVSARAPQAKVIKRIINA
ncbi:MAG: hypothetical protein Q4E65_07760 [Clostridia bacterium]|nr:hypothetical protein [Clostridia bacterium]